MNARQEHSQTLVVIGNGMACWKLCQKMVEHGANEELRIVVFGEEPRPAYDRVHLTDLFAGVSDESLTLAPEDWYSAHGIELYLDDPVVFVDRARSRVCSESGMEVEYNRLVFATGSRPFVPPMEGTELPGVFVYRTVDDVYAIEEFSQGATRAAVIGGGLLGLEAAKAIADLGLSVHVIEHGPGLMHRQIDMRGAEFLKEAIEKLGVRVHVQTDVAQIAPAGAPNEEGEAIVGADRLALTFAAGGKLVVDMVLISAGIRPRGELAEKCGLVCAPNGGIVVDDRLETSDPQIYAIGECATHRGKTYGLVLPGYRMVDVLVTNLLGGDASFQGADQSTKLKLMGITVAAFGEYDGDKQPLSSALRYTTGGVYRKLVTRNGRLIGVVTVGDWENLDRIRESLNAPVLTSFWDMRRFRSTGNLWPKSESLKVSDWAPESLVCGCLAVSRGTLTEAQAKGCTTVADLSRKTGAGTMCGSCKPLLADLLGVDEERRLPVPISVNIGQVAVRDRTPSTRREGSLRPRGADADGAPRMKRNSVRPPALDAPPPSRRTLMRGAASADLRSTGKGAPNSDLRSMLKGTPNSDSRPLGSEGSNLEPRPAVKPIPSPPALEPMQEQDEAPTSMQLLQKIAVLAMPELEKLASTAPPPPAAEEVDQEEEEDFASESDLDVFAGSTYEPFPESRRSWIPPARLSIAPPPHSIVPPPRAAAALPAERGLKPLLIASCAAIGLSILALAWSPGRLARSIHQVSRLETLGNDSTWKQTSGYLLIGLAACSLLVSARKRLKWFTFSDVALWRLIHGVLGALTLVVLLMHTGFQLGSHMIRVLTINFVSVALLGALAGIIVAISARWSPLAARDRRLGSSRLHFLVCLPLPILIILHVLQIYFY